MIQKGKFHFLTSCCCHNTDLYCQVFHIICFIRRHLKRHLLLAFCKKLSAIYFQFKLLSRRGQVRDPRHQRGAKRLQDGHLQQDQERHEARRQVERNNHQQHLEESLPQVVGGDREGGILHRLQRRLQHAPC